MLIFWTILGTFWCICIHVHRVLYNRVHNQGGDTSEQCRCLMICMSQPSVCLTCPAWNIFQNEKCHLLIEHETQKLKALDESHNQNLKEWRDKLRPRKKVTVSGLVGP